MKKYELRHIIRETIKEFFRHEFDDECEPECHSFLLKGNYMDYATCRKNCVMRHKHGDKHVAVANALGLK
jgi:hypothetical protein